MIAMTTTKDILIGVPVPVGEHTESSTLAGLRGTVVDLSRRYLPPPFSMLFFLQKSNILNLVTIHYLSCQILWLYVICVLIRWFAFLNSSSLRSDKYLESIYSWIKRNCYIGWSLIVLFMNFLRLISFDSLFKPILALGCRRGTFRIMHQSTPLKRLLSTTLGEVLVQNDNHFRWLRILHLLPWSIISM